MKPYKLLLLTYSKSESLAASTNSNRMMGHLLADEFARLPNVELTYRASHECRDSDLDNADAVLAHTYLGDDMLGRLMEYRKTNNLFFAYCESLPYAGADVSFTWVPWPDVVSKRYTLRFPCSKEVLKKYTVPKTRKSILLDHAWQPRLGTESEWTNRLIDWVEPLKDECKIAKLVSSTEKDFVYPDWLETIKPTTYFDFLDKTRQFETFIITHMGSYNHSIVDMAGRGMRLLAPHGFTHDDVVDSLGINLFGGIDSLMAELDKPIGEGVSRQIDKMTDAGDLVAKMNAIFMGALSGNQ